MARVQKNTCVCFFQTTPVVIISVGAPHAITNDTPDPQTTMIDLHYWPTPNGWKVAMMLEECTLPYRMVPVDIGKGEQFHAQFLAISPNNRMPAIVDHAPPDHGAALSVFESGAILIYLAEKTGRFMPTGLRERSTVLQWLMWQMGGLGPMAGQLGHFLLYAPEPVVYAQKRYADEVDRLYGVLDKRLAQTGAFVAGRHYTIADMAIFPWIRIHRKQQIDLARFAHVARWHNAVFERPAVARALALGQELRANTLTDAARKALFGQTADTVRQHPRDPP